MAEPLKVERLPRRPAPEREILTARERLDRARGRRNPLKGLLTGLALLAVFALLLVGLFFALSAADSKQSETAPWAKPTAPQVTPQPLDEQ